MEEYIVTGGTIALDRSALNVHRGVEPEDFGARETPPKPAEFLPVASADVTTQAVCQLITTNGADKGNRCVMQDGQTVVIGRSPECEFQLSDLRVSRRHCVVEVREGTARILHSGGSGGTRVNSKPIESHVLKPGDVVQVGETTMRFELGDTVPTESKPAAVLTPATVPAAKDFFDLIGQKIHNYEVEKELARGNSGAVFKCRDTAKNRDVALKILGPELSKDEEEVQRFVRAMKTMFPVRHENLIRIYNAGKTGKHVWVSLEYVDGESVARLIEKIGTVGMLDWQFAFQVAVQIARGLEAAYDHKIVHRNITPENIMIRSSDKVAKLGDMMLAKALETNKAEQITRPGQLIGEIAYAPPERTGGDGQIDCRSDIYGLGATIYALITGRPPHEAPSLSALITKIRTETPKSPKTFQLSINDMFEGAVMQMLAARPEDRYATPIELLRDLERIGKFAGISV